MEEEQSDCELELSCSSSEYEIEDSGDEGRHRGDVLGVKPYQFEPYADENSADTGEGGMDAEDGENHRLQNLDWYLCHRCTIMVTARECVCCLEDHKVKSRLEAYQQKLNGKELKCVTEHPGFHSVCLDEYVLEAAYSHHRQQYGAQVHDQNERSRYTAYRQYVRWIWGYLGKEIRVIIPACAVYKIRQIYPSADGTYCGFMYADESH